MIKSFVIFLCLYTSFAQAVLNIEITEGVSGALPIAIMPFSWEGEGSPPVDITQIITADLTKSGRFSPIKLSQDLVRVGQQGSMDYRYWRLMDVENLLRGKLIPQKDGSFVIQYRLFDIYRGGQLIGKQVASISEKGLRKEAHRIGDAVYQRLLGEKGAFATYMAYVTEKKVNNSKQYTLEVSESDGYNPQVIFKSQFPIMSPAWSPDGRKIAYVSFENNRAEIYIQSVWVRSKRQRVANFKGLNSAPAWSPDGLSMAVTLSFSGNPEIYIYTLKSGKMRQLTHNEAIDTEPAWTPDSQSIVFTSDRSGNRPQLYRIAAQGGQAKRITFDGVYNAHPALSPDGRYLAMVHGFRQNGKTLYRIAMQDTKTGSLDILTNSKLDESPTFSPNGSMIIYATNQKNRNVLKVVSVGGGAGSQLGFSSGKVREPAWAPFNR
jgi:TolB protein